MLEVTQILPVGDKLIELGHYPMQFYATNNNNESHYQHGECLLCNIQFK